MPSRLKNIRKFVPGGYFYQEPAPMAHFFPAESYDLKQQAYIVCQYRLSNKKPRATIAECMEDIDLFTCHRLGGNSRWCYDTDKGFTTLHPQVKGSGCATCGHRH